ncbi:hypothetical protein F4X10_02205 [Candidatus Poribacteria bacterium]|nr:hypothetical protein [Candidatus Poribacteria bacterium]
MISNKKLAQAGLFCLKEAAYNVLLETSDTETPELSNQQINELLGIERSFQDSYSYPLIRGVLDVLVREGRIKRVDKNGKKMMWRII